MLPINVLYRNLVLSGAAFGAHRWLAALQRACERFASLATLGVPHHDVAGGMQSYLAIIWTELECERSWFLLVGSDAGGEAEHDEAVAADGEQLLREPELVATAAVDAALRHHGRERPGLHAPQHRLRPAQRRRPQRRHLHLAARPRRPRLRLRPRRERALPGTGAPSLPSGLWTRLDALTYTTTTPPALVI
jgi:hypothetical protein